MHVQGDCGQFQEVGASLALAPRPRGERRPSVPLRLYLRPSRGGITLSCSQTPPFTHSPLPCMPPAETKDAGG